MGQQYHDKALLKLAEGMKERTKERLKEVMEDIATLGNGGRHLPFCELRPGGAHEFGAWRAWIEKKSFKELSPWDEMRWRPLVSFRNIGGGNFLFFF